MIPHSTALAAIVSAALPGVNPVSVHRAPHGSTDGMDAGIVQDSRGDRWLVLAPRDAAAGARQENVAYVLPHLADALPFTVPVPVGLVQLRHGAGAMVYPWSDGYLLDFSAIPPGRGLASHIGTTIAHIHGVDAALIDDLGMPLYSATTCRDRSLVRLDRIASSGCLPPRLLTAWEAVHEPVNWWRFMPTVVHGSLTDHSLRAEFTDETDATSGTITCVTGWEDVHVGDPAVDFASVAQQMRPETLESVYEAYHFHRSTEYDPGLFERALLHAEMSTAEEYIKAVRAGHYEQQDRLTATLRSIETKRAEGITRVGAPVPTMTPSAPASPPPAPEPAEAAPLASSASPPDTAPITTPSAEPASAAEPKSQPVAVESSETPTSPESDATPTAQVPAVEGKDTSPTPHTSADAATQPLVEVSAQTAAPVDEPSSPHRAEPPGAEHLSSTGNGRSATPPRALLVGPAPAPMGVPVAKANPATVSEQQPVTGPAPAAEAPVTEPTAAPQSAADEAPDTMPQALFDLHVPEAGRRTSTPHQGPTQSHTPQASAQELASRETPAVPSPPASLAAQHDVERAMRRAQRTARRRAFHPRRMKNYRPPGTASATHGS